MLIEKKFEENGIIIILKTHFVSNKKKK